MGSDDDKGDIGWGCGQAPSEGKKDIGRQGIGSGSGPDGGKSDRPDGNEDEWKGGGLARCLQSTRIRVVEELVLPQRREGRKKRRRSRRKRSGWKGW